MIKLPIFYSENQVAMDKDIWSPSAAKPKRLVSELLKADFPIEIIAPNPVGINQICKAHDKLFVNKVLNCEIENGFGTISQVVAQSLPFTSGAMLDAALAAKVDVPSVALVSGFHHAGYDFTGGFCTFNGLMVCAIELQEKYNKKVAIIDADYHFGNGTEDILGKLGLYDKIWHYSFGKYFHKPEQAKKYLEKIKYLEESLSKFNPDVIIFQAGADVHVNDPLGGLFTDDEIYLRDYTIFEMAKNLNAPICWNLAGGYQRGENNDLAPVIRIHMNTFRAALRVYNLVRV